MLKKDDRKEVVDGWKKGALRCWMVDGGWDGSGWWEGLQTPQKLDVLIVEIVWK